MIEEIAARVLELLTRAKLKRSAARIAYDECDDDAWARLSDEARVLEGAANDLDPKHESPAWKVDPAPKLKK